jgi:3-oxoacyl-(acyl-carrier-protein) synthase
MSTVPVAITGLGAVTGLGLSFQATFERLLRAESAVQRAGGTVAERLKDALVVPVTPAFDATVPPAEASLDRATQLALSAARGAMSDANFEPSATQRARVGVFVGTGLGGFHTIEPLFQRMHARLHGAAPGDPMSMHPLSVPRIMPSAAASWLSIQHGFQGPTHTYSVACASSAVALGEAYRSIRHGYTDAVVVIGTESMLTLGSLAAWSALRVMARPDPDDVASSCKPFDQRRSGFVLGEGAAAVVLERADLARARGVRGYGTLVGYGSSSDASHITLPSVDGQAAAMRQALQEAEHDGLPADAIGYVNAHGTATPAGDVAEMQSIQQAFGAHAQRLAVSATKSMHGHVIGAAGALEFAIAVKAMATGCIPPTAHLALPDAQCPLDCVPGQARRDQDLAGVMSNSFAFGGSNVALVARRLAS